MQGPTAKPAQPARHGYQDSALNLNLQLHVVPGDCLPIYRQLELQIAEAVASRQLTAGQRLPSQCELSEQLVISPHSVRKAYAGLRRDRIIDTRPGNGTFVGPMPVAAEPGQRRRRLAGLARQLVVQGRLLGVPLAELEDLLGLLERELLTTATAAG